MPRTTPPLPLPVRRALKKLGSDIRDARRRRRIQTAVMADRLQISRPTLRKLEQGDPRVGMGSYATALYVLGLVERLGDLADIVYDAVGGRQRPSTYIDATVLHSGRLNAGGTGGYGRICCREGGGIELWGLES